MNKREIKKRISESYKRESPNLKESIISSCKLEEQISSERERAEAPSPTKRNSGYNIALRCLAAATICAIIFVSGFAMGIIMPESSGGISHGAESFVYIDVNPSIELQLDGEGRVLECVALNQDAEKILSELDLKNVEMKTALTAIIGVMYVNGYLTEESNSILVSVGANDQKSIGALLTRITDQIDKMFKDSGLNCSIIGQTVNIDDEMLGRAKQNGVSVGKLGFVDKMIDAWDEFEAEDISHLLGMSIKDLNLIYSERPFKGLEGDPFGNDISIGNVGGIINKNDALSLILNSIEADPSAIEHYEISASIIKDGEYSNAVYTLSVKFKHDPTTYVFKVDCENGEIILLDDRHPNAEINPNGNGGEMPDGPPEPPPNGEMGPPLGGAPWMDGEVNDHTEEAEEE